MPLRLKAAGLSMLTLVLSLPPHYCLLPIASYRKSNFYCKLWLPSYQRKVFKCWHLFSFSMVTHLVYLDVCEDHDSQGTIEGHRAGEDKVANVFRERTLPLWRRTWQGEVRNETLDHFCWQSKQEIKFVENQIRTISYQGQCQPMSCHSEKEPRLSPL